MKLIYKVIVIVISCLLTSACSTTVSQTDPTSDKAIIQTFNEIDQAVDSLSQLECSFDTFKDKIDILVKPTVFERIKADTFIGQHPLNYLTVIGADIAQPMCLSDIKDNLDDELRTDYIEQFKRVQADTLGTIRVGQTTISSLYHDGEIHSVFTEKSYQFEKLYLFDQFPFNRNQPFSTTVYRRYDYVKSDGKIRWVNYRVLNAINPEQGKMSLPVDELQNNDIFKINKDQTHQIIVPSTSNE